MIENIEVELAKTVQSVRGIIKWERLTPETQANLIKFAKSEIAWLSSQGFVQTEVADIPEPDSNMLMDLAGGDEFIAFQIYVKSIGKANPNGLLTRKEG